MKTILSIDSALNVLDNFKKRNKLHFDITIVSIREVSEKEVLEYTFGVPNPKARTLECSRNKNITYCLEVHSKNGSSYTHDTNLSKLVNDFLESCVWLD